MKQYLLLCALFFEATLLQAQKNANSYKFTGTQAVFTENKGQVVDMNGQPVPDVLAKAAMPGLDMYLTKTGVTYVMLQYTEDLAARPSPAFPNDKKYKVTCSRVDVALTGATLTNGQIQFTGDAGWLSNYYRTSDAKGQLAVSHFKNMSVQNVYPGIDWVWKFNAKGNLEYEFVVHPGADPSVIKMQYSYADLKTVKNNLNISTRIGSMTEGPLLASNSNNKVSINYNLDAANKAVSFVPGTYDNSKDLVIDPPLALNWSAQFGGSFSNGLRGVATDKNAGIYLCGFTTSSDFPLFNPHYGNEYYDSTYNGNSDAIILKLDTNQHLKYATFLGGPGNDFANSICFGSTGGFASVFVTGGAQTGFPIINGSTTCTGQDAFVSGFNALNLSLIYSSFFGGGGTDEGLKICITANTNYVYFVGYTNSTSASFPAVGGGGYYQNTVTGQEAFIGRLYYNIYFGNIYTNWLTKFGGSGDDYATSVTTDSLNNAIVCGYTNSANIPLAHADSSYYQSANAGGYDGFIAKFNTNNNLLNSTYYGGSGDDYFYDVATGINGNFAFTGRTSSTNFPRRAIGGYGYNQTSLGDAAGDAFIIKAANNLTVKWATYFGGSAGDVGTGVATDSAGQMYVSGFTFSHNFPVMSFPGAYNQATNHGNADGFVARFTDLGIQNWTTYKGDSCYQYPYSIAYDRVFNKFYVAGQGMLDCIGDSMGQSLPDTGQVVNGVSSVGFAWSFGGQNSPPDYCVGFNANASYLVQACPNECNGIAKVLISGGHSPYSIIWSDGGTRVTDSTLCPAESWVEVRDSLGCTAEADVQFNPVNISFSVQPVICIPGPGIITANISGGNASQYHYQWGSAEQPFNGYFQGDSTILFVPDTGTYNLTVTDGRGCTVTNTATMTYYNQDPTGNLEVYQYPDCGNDYSGVVALNLFNTDGIFPAGNVVWEDQNYNVVTTGPVAYGLNAGQTYYAIDSAYCYNGVTAPVTYQFYLGYATDLAYMQAYNPSSCISNDGQGQVYYNSQQYYVSGNNPDDQYYGGYITVDSYPWITYQWSDGETDSAAVYLPTGNASVTVTDADGCSVSFSQLLSLPPPVVVSYIDSAYCAGTGGGKIDLSNSYSQNWFLGLNFQWSTGYAGSVLSNVPSGTYTVTVTDQLSCADTASFFVPQGTPVRINITESDPLCSGESGTVIVTGSAGLPPYQGTGTFTEHPGNYQFTITDDAGCQSINFVTVNSPSPLTMTVDSISGPVCNNGTETVLVTASGGTRPYTGTGTLFEPVGVNEITVYDINGCSVTQTLIVSAGLGNQIVPVNTYAPILCHGDSTTLTITATGGHGTLTGTGTFRVAAGTHYYTISDSVGCSAMDTVVITQPAQLTVSLTDSGITCRPGSVSALPNGGSPLYMFQWSNSPGNYVSNSSIAVTDTGIYTVTVQDENLCSATASVHVDFNNTPGPYGAIDIVTYPDCGLFDGSLYLNYASGTVTWYDYGSYISTGPVLNNITTDYEYTAIDSGYCFNGAVAPVTFTITVPSAQFPYWTYSASSTNATTCSPFNGTASASFDFDVQYTVNSSWYGPAYADITPAVPDPFCSNCPIAYNFTYQWSNGQTEQNISGLSAGTYTVTITSGSCNNVQSVTITDPTPVITAVNTSGCTGGGVSITNVTGGNSPYTYNWSTGATTRAVMGLVTGTYFVTVSNTNQCSAIDTFNIVAQPALAAQNTITPVLCYGDTATIIITATGGQAPYTGTGTFNRTAGTYYFTISDHAGCSVMDTVVITQPARLTVNLSAADIACYSTSGQIYASPSGGSPLYMFQWSTSPGNYVSNSYIAVTDTGTYWVTVEDENLCSVTDSVHVDYYNLPIQYYDVTIEQFPSCGMNNGVVYFGDPVQSNVSWWDDYNFYNSVATGDTFTTAYSNGYANDFHGFRIVDSANCVNGHFIAVEYDIYLYSATSNNQIQTVNYPTGCNTLDGHIELYTGTYWVMNIYVNGVYTILNNTPLSISNFQPISYQWSNGDYYSPAPRGEISDTFGYFNTGNYTVTIQDGTCIDTASIDLNHQLTAPLIANYVVSQPCNPDSSSITLTSLANNIPNTYGSTINNFQWSNGDTTQSVAGLSPGTYTVTITGPNACPVIDTFNITAPTSSLTITNSITPIACYNGSATVTVTATGGTQPYTGTGVFTEVPGNYVLTVTDSSGCSANDSIVVPPSLATSALVINSVAAPVLCHSGSSTVTITATGGVSPYTGTGVYQKPAGTYVMTVTDSLGCTASDTLTINQPGILYVTNQVNPVLCYGDSATINLTCAGGTSPYTGTGSFARPAGNYVFDITDANGCIATDTVRITQPAPLVVNDTVTSNALCFGGTGVVHITATGGTSPYYNIGNITQPAGNQLLVVTDQNGCADTVYATITQPTPVNVTLQWLDTIVHCKDTAKVLITATGGNGPYTGTGTVTYTHNGVYTIAVSDQNGCAIDTTINLHFDTCTSIEDLSSDFGVSVYPNPAADKFFVKFMNRLTEPADVRLYAVDGKLVMFKNLGAGAEQCEMDCNLLASGVYILRTVVMSKEYNFKVVVTR